MGRWRTATALVSVAALGACGQGKYTYVSNRADKTYMRVPFDWKVFEVDTTASDGALPAPWQRVFDAAAEPTLDHLSVPAPPDVAGRLTVFYIDAKTADGLSSSAVRSAVAPMQTDPLDFDKEGATVTGKVQDFRIEAREGGLKGSHVVYEIEAGTAKVTYDQTTLVDPIAYPNPQTGNLMFKVYALSVHCESACYEKYKVQIADIVNSWQVTR